MFQHFACAGALAVRRGICRNGLLADVRRILDETIVDTIVERLDEALDAALASVHKSAA